jgi:hypothetical protein
VPRAIVSGALLRYGFSEDHGAAAALNDCSGTGFHFLSNGGGRKHNGNRRYDKLLHFILLTGYSILGDTGSILEGSSMRLSMKFSTSVP